MSDKEPRRSISYNINALIRTTTTTNTIDRPVQLGDGTWTNNTEEHRTTHPPLLDQLDETITSSPLSASDSYAGNAKSKPPSRLDAVVLLERIRKESRTIADTIRLRRTRNLTDRLSAIAGATPDLTTDDRDWITKLTRGWVVTARILTGWDAPPYAPDVPCPNTECERRSSLRVRLHDRVATCIECGVWWDQDSVEQLGTYVRWAAEHLRGPKHWLTDDDGYPIECAECHETRIQMAERKIARRHAEKAAAA